MRPTIILSFVTVRDRSVDNRTAAILVNGRRSWGCAPLHAPAHRRPLPSRSAFGVRGERRARETRFIEEPTCACAPSPPPFVLGLALAVPAVAQEDTGPTTPTFKEGDVISFDKIDSAEALPAAASSGRTATSSSTRACSSRSARCYRDYSPRRRLQGRDRRSTRARRRSAPSAASRATPPASPSRSTRSTARAIPQAGVKIIWNFDYQLGGRRRAAPGLLLLLGPRRAAPALLRGHREDHHALAPRRARVRSKARRRPVPRREAQDRVRHRGRRALRRARHPAHDLPLQGVRRRRRRRPRTTTPGSTCRRCAACAASRSAQRTDAVSGTDFTFDDLRSFDGIVPQYEWKCLGEMDIIAPVNTQGEGLPVREGPQLRPLRPLLRRRPLGAAPRVSSPLHAEERGPPVPPQGHLHRQADRWSRSTPSRTTARTSSGRSSGTTTAGARTMPEDKSVVQAAGTSVPEPRDNRVIVRHRS